MNFTIIGGSGFIGTRLCRRFERAGQPFMIVDKVPSQAFPASVSIADVRLVETLRESVLEGSVLINLAAGHRDDVQPLSLYDEVNVEGARNICTIAREKSVTPMLLQ
jgi:nucleoside-diphosphate-sugar epimerase